MRYPLYALGSSIAFLIIGCGSSSSSGSETPLSVVVSDAYIVHADVVSGDKKAYEDRDSGSGVYTFEESISENIVVKNGVNDINPTNSKADDGEPYAPTLKAPYSYKNITPFTTMMILDEERAKDNYPNAYKYKSDFDFDVVKVSDENLSIAKENIRAAFELSALDGTRKVPKLRIINGEQVLADDDTWRFIVSIQQYKHHFCGGSLIHPQWVLTAAHCISRESVQPSILAGTYSLVVEGVDVISDALYPHPDYNSDTVDNDIGLIHLKDPINSVKPIELDHSIPADNTMISVAGWGNMSIDSEIYPDDLMQVDMPVINFDTCNNSYGYLTNSMFCAGYMDGSKDSCQGDSGGPLIQDNRLSGIVSFGGSDTQPCGAPDYPGVYTRVANYIDWIESHTGPLSSSSSSSSSSESSSSSSSSEPSLEEIFTMIENAKSIDELNQIVIDYMGYYNGVFSE
jgi:trypsin